MLSRHFCNFVHMYKVDSRYIDFAYSDNRLSRSENLVPVFNMEIYQQVAKYCAKEEKLEKGFLEKKKKKNVPPTPPELSFL